MPRTDINTAAEIYTTASHYRISPERLAGLLVRWAMDNVKLLQPFFKMHRLRRNKLRVLGWNEPEYGVVVPLASELLKWLVDQRVGGYLGMMAVWDAWKTHNKTAWRTADGGIRKRLMERATMK